MKNNNKRVSSIGVCLSFLGCGHSDAGSWSPDVTQVADVWDGDVWMTLLSGQVPESDIRYPP